MRVLFLTADTRFYTPEGNEQVFLQGLIDSTESLHVILLCNRSEGYTTKKIAENAWIYPTNSWTPWLQYVDAMRIARFEIVWQGEFLAQIIYSDDPFVAGRVGRSLAHTFDKSWVVNIHEFFWTKLEKTPFFARHLLLPFKALTRARRICVFSEFVHAQMSATAKELEEKIYVFPRLRDPHQVSQPSEQEVRRVYPQFTFSLLVAATTDEDGNFPIAFEILRLVRMRPYYPNAGMVIVGCGEYLATLRAQAATAGLSEWVACEEGVEALAAYAHTANIFLWLGGGGPHEEDLVVAAEAHSRIVALDTPFARSIIDDGINGVLVGEYTPEAFASKLCALNENTIAREQYKVNSDMKIGGSLPPTHMPQEIFTQLWQDASQPTMRQMPFFNPKPVYELLNRPVRFPKFWIVLEQMYPKLYGYLKRRGLLDPKAEPVKKDTPIE